MKDQKTVTQFLMHLRAQPRENIREITKKTAGVEGAQKIIAIAQRPTKKTLLSEKYTFKRTQNDVKIDSIRGNLLTESPSTHGTEANFEHQNVIQLYAGSARYTNSDQ